MQLIAIDCLATRQNNVQLLMGRSEMEEVQAVSSPSSFKFKQIESTRTVKRHDCVCVRLLEDVYGRFFEYLD